jgi:uncharacterized membrane protein
MTGAGPITSNLRATGKLPVMGNLRVRSIDALRGLVMVIMALDHVREYFHSGPLHFQPEDLSRTTTLIFLTRWVTHICAPVFMFTAGIGAFFWLHRGHGTGHTKFELSRFLWTRGLWLVVLELTVVRFALMFSLFSGPVILEVIWALGCSMIALGFLIYLPVRVLAVLSLLVVALHNLADPVRAASFGRLAWVWDILHRQGVFHVDGVSVQTAYPLVPWIAVMALGFCFGEVMALDSARRRRWLIGIGLTVTAAFFVIRGINRYGDPFPWSNAVPGMTVLSFLRCNKYPPSLDFLLMTLGPAILLLGWLDRIEFSAVNPLIVFGRVPLFYFVVHLFLIHGLNFPAALIRYGHAGFLLNPLPSMGGDMNLYPADYGYGLGTVYALWAAVVLFMYPLCLWFARLKSRRTDWWLSYL